MKKLPHLYDRVKEEQKALLYFRRERAQQLISFRVNPGRYHEMIEKEKSQQGNL